MMLFVNQATDATSDQFVASGNSAVLQMAGTWGGAAITVETRQDEMPWAAHPDGIFTDTHHVVIDTMPGMMVRLALSGAGGSTNLSASIVDQERN